VLAPWHFRVTVNSPNFSAQKLDCSLGSLLDYTSKCSSDSSSDSSDCSLDCFSDYTRWLSPGKAVAVPAAGWRSVVKTLENGVKLTIWLPGSVSVLVQWHLRVTVYRPNFSAQKLVSSSGFLSDYTTDCSSDSLSHSTSECSTNDTSDSLSNYLSKCSMHYLLDSSSDCSSVSFGLYICRCSDLSTSIISTRSSCWLTSNNWGYSYIHKISRCGKRHFKCPSRDEPLLKLEIFVFIAQHSRHIVIRYRFCVPGKNKYVERKSLKLWGKTTFNFMITRNCYQNINFMNTKHTLHCNHVFIYSSSFWRTTAEVFLSGWKKFSTSSPSSRGYTSTPWTEACGKTFPFTFSSSS